MFEYPTYLIHYGTLGQKWGVRKYQNEDGTWTEEGLRRRRKENFKYLRDSAKKHKWSEAENKAKELTKKFSDDYKKKFDSKIKSIKTRKDLINVINGTTKKTLDELEIDKEVNNIIGEYSNKIYDKRMGQTYGDLLRRVEYNRLYKEANEKYTDEFDKQVPKIAREIESADLLTEENYWDQRLKKNENGEIIARTNDEEIFRNDKRLDNAAITGLKALDGKEADLSTSNKWWFICEDQTIGKATVADLANRGYTEKQIKSLIEKSKDMYYRPSYGETIYDIDYDEKIKPPKGIFQLAESYIDDKYIKDCVRIAKENTISDAKQSRIKSLIASGKSQEEVAKMLGVSTSTVNKYK